jgi:hypothetical protein
MQVDVVGIEAHHLAWWRIFSPVPATSKGLAQQHIDNQTEKENQRDQPYPSNPAKYRD